MERRRIDYNDNLNHARNATRIQLILAILFILVSVAGSGSTAVGDLLDAPKSVDDLAILNLQPNNSVAKASAEALKKVRGDVILQADQFAILKNGERLTIVAHGSPTSAAGMSAADIANLLAKNKLSPAQIELCACKTGTGKFAQQLADLTGVPVQAPRGNVNVLSDITGVPQVRDPITGALRAPGELMQTFTPKPSGGFWQGIKNWFSF